jgi:hypothetical protein
LYLVRCRDTFSSVTFLPSLHFLRSRSSFFLRSG